MTEKNKTGTAVLGNFDLKNGQRILILEILYPSRYYENIGIVMVGWLKTSFLL